MFINSKRFRTIIIKITAIAILILFAGSLSSCSGQAESTIIVVGSTSVQPFAELLAEEFESSHPGENIDIQGGGSAAGIMAAEEGIAEIGMSSRSLKDDEQGLLVVEIAKDGLAIVVHPKNPVADLTLEQIRDIYTGEITNWGQVNGQDAQIHLIAREDGSGTRGAFEDLVMGKEYRITPKAIVQNSNGAVKQLVSDDPDSIGFISLGLAEVDNKVKALRLDGVEATRENVINHSYGLFRPFLFVFKTQPEGIARQFVDYVLSEEGQQILIHEGLIPGKGAEE